MRWQDCFELVEVSFGSHMKIGGDPDLYNDRGYKIYRIRNKATGEVESISAAPKYTAEFYAKKKFEELLDSVDTVILK